MKYFEKPWPILACTVLLLTTFFFLNFKAHACAFCGKYKVVNVSQGDVLNLRAGPSIENPIVGALPYNGINIEMAGECNDKGWCKIKFFGVEAWLNTKYLSRTDAEKE